MWWLELVPMESQQQELQVVQAVEAWLGEQLECWLLA